MKKLSSRISAIFSSDLPETELETPTFSTLLKIVWNVIRTFPQERTGQIIGSAFILLMLWGYHGNLDLLKVIIPGFHGPGFDIGSRPQIIPGVPWDNELISFWGGAILLVVVPILLIKFVFKQNLSDYGLGFPPKGRRKLAWLTFLGLTLLTAPAFWVGAQDPGMRATYPFFRPFPGILDFVLYELTYLPFFIAIEFIFRGYMLFGLANIQRDEIRKRGISASESSAFYFGKYALLIQMLSYTAWHLGKPLPELWGTLIWGLAAGVLAYTVRSIWPVVASHWLLNVLLDGIIIYGP